MMTDFEDYDHALTDAYFFYSPADRHVYTALEEPEVGTRILNLGTGDIWTITEVVDGVGRVERES